MAEKTSVPYYAEQACVYCSGGGVDCSHCDGYGIVQALLYCIEDADTYVSNGYSVYLISKSIPYSGNTAGP